MQLTPTRPGLWPNLCVPTRASSCFRGNIFATMSLQYKHRSDTKVQIHYFQGLFRISLYGPISAHISCGVALHSSQLPIRKMNGLQTVLATHHPTRGTLCFQLLFFPFCNLLFVHLIAPPCYIWSACSQVDLFTTDSAKSLTWRKHRLLAHFNIDTLKIYRYISVYIDILPVYNC